MTATQQVLRAVEQERWQQDDKLGEQSHSPEIWLAILTEEVGEVVQAILALRFGAAVLGGTASRFYTRIDHYR